MIKHTEKPEDKVKPTSVLRLTHTDTHTHLQDDTRPVSPTKGEFVPEYHSQTQKLQITNDSVKAKS